MKCLSVGVDSVDDLLKAVIGIPCLMYTCLDVFGNNDKKTGKIFCFIAHAPIIMIMYTHAVPKGNYMIHNIYTGECKWSDTSITKEIKESPSNYVVIPVVNIKNIEEIVI